MWKRSFVATTVALGGSVDDALAAIGPSGRSSASSMSSPSPDTSYDFGAVDLGAAATDLVTQLRAPQRAARAAALAKAVRDIVLSIEEGTLR